MIQTDIIIIGAGPVGLFTVFEAGLLKLRCHLIDSLPQPGGQCSEIYPKKPIYDIPGFPSVLAGELIDNLMEQSAPFKPGFTLGEAALSIKIQNFTMASVVSLLEVVIRRWTGQFSLLKIISRARLFLFTVAVHSVVTLIRFKR